MSSLEDFEKFIGGYIGGSDGMRYFKVVSVDGKKVKDDDEGRYKITQKSSPGGAARKAFSQLTKKYNSSKIVFVIKETTQGSKKKEYGPYEGIRVRLTTPKKVMYKGSKKPVLIKHEDKLRLIKEVKQKGGDNNNNNSENNNSENNNVNISFLNNNENNENNNGLTNWQIKKLYHINTSKKNSKKNSKKKSKKMPIISEIHQRNFTKKYDTGIHRPLQEYNNVPE